MNLFILFRLHYGSKNCIKLVGFREEEKNMALVTPSSDIY
jgi:hypothetical protein